MYILRCKNNKEKIRVALTFISGYHFEIKIMEVEGSLLILVELFA